MNGEPCPICGSPAATTVGPVYSGTTRFLWRRRRFDETLFRCLEGHVYSVRDEDGVVTAEAHESLDDWLEQRAGAQRPERPTGL
jgi:hypothetical protein